MQNRVALLLLPLSNATFNLLSFQVKCQDILGRERQADARGLLHHRQCSSW